MTHPEVRDCYGSMLLQVPITFAILRDLGVWNVSSILDLAAGTKFLHSSYNKHPAWGPRKHSKGNLFSLRLYFCANIFGPFCIFEM